MYIREHLQQIILVRQIILKTCYSTAHIPVLSTTVCCNGRQPRDRSSHKANAKSVAHDVAPAAVCWMTSTARDHSKMSRRHCVMIYGAASYFSMSFLLFGVILPGLTPVADWVLNGP